MHLLTMLQLCWEGWVASRGCSRAGPQSSRLAFPAYSRHVMLWSVVWLNCWVLAGVCLCQGRGRCLFVVPDSCHVLPQPCSVFTRLFSP